MEQKTFHGSIRPVDVAQALVAEFNTGSLRAQQITHEGDVIVQIASARAPSSGGATAITVHISPVEDGVTVALGQQDWLGVAASLSRTAFMALINPMMLIGRLDAIADDINAFQLSSRIWETIESTAKGHGATFEISERLRRVTCAYCLTANPVGEGACIACGAPMGPSQPMSCPRCGFVAPAGSSFCPNCGAPLGT
jgi:hypothetical protein